MLAAAGYNFSLLLRWLERLLRALMRMLLAAPWWLQQRMLINGSSRTTHEYELYLAVEDIDYSRTKTKSIAGSTELSILR